MNTIALTNCLTFLTALTFATQLSAIAQPQPDVHRDVPKKHWAYASVFAVINSGLFEGLPNDTFGGDKPMKRYELAVVAARYLIRIPIAYRDNIRDEIGVGFSDVSREHWAAQALSLATSQGIIEGLPNGKYNGGKNVNRYDGAMILVRLLARQEQHLPNDLREVKQRRQAAILPLGAYEDVPESHWAVNPIARLSSAGIFEGFADGKFHGHKPMTRYEFAVCLSRLLNQRPPCY